MASAIPAIGQTASALIKEGDVLDNINFPGHLVTVIDSPAENHAGGWAINLNTSDGGTTLSHIWGTADGIAVPAVVVSEQMIGPLTPTEYETRIGFSNAGSGFYSSTGTGGPDGSFDGVFLDLTPVAIEGDPLPAGPLSHLFWSFASGPTMSGNGIGYFVGGTRDTVSGGTTARGLFDSAGTALLFSGDEIPGLPVFMDFGGTPAFDFSVSAQGNQYIIEIAMEATDGVTTNDDNVMVISGAGLFIDGILVREGNTLPAVAGGVPGELWDNFDAQAINEFGEYMFTGDSTDATTTDEFVLVNGSIVLRELDMIGLDVIDGDIEAGDINENGDWAVVWDFGAGGPEECLIVNGQIIVRENDEVDLDGDSLPDAGSALTDFSGLSGGMVIGDRDASGNIPVYFAGMANDGLGGTGIDTFFRVIVAGTPGLAGDLEINVVDSPDPQSNIGGPITYNVSVRNNSPNTATGVAVVSTLDPTVTFNAGLSDAIAVEGPVGTVTAAIGSMDPNAFFFYTFVVDTSIGGTVTTTSTLSGNEADPDTSNNTVISTTEVSLIADLAITITDDPDPLNDAAGVITYTVDVTNEGPSDATGVVVTMNLDPTSVFNAGLSDPIANHAAGVVTANIGNITALDTFSFDVVVNVTTQGTLTADASVVGNEADDDPGNDSATADTLFVLESDLSITVVDSPDPVIPAGGNITYAVTVANAGPSDATGVLATINLDPDTNFVSVDPPGSHLAGVVTANIGALAAGNDVMFNIVVQTTAIGRPSADGSVVGSGTETDPDPSNNSSAALTLVIDDIADLPCGIFSNILTSSTSDVPGLAPAKFGTGCDRPFRSPDGRLWIVSCDTDLATSIDEVVLLGTLCGSSPAIQEGVSLLDLGDMVGLINQQMSLNDAGQFAFTTNSNAATTQDEVVVKWDGSQFVTVAREGDFTVDFLLYGATNHSANIDANGLVAFNSDTSAGRNVLYQDDGATILISENIDIPAGQDGGATDTWQLFDTDDFTMDATATNYLVQGDTSGASATDDILAYNNSVVVQEGVIIPGSGFVSPVDAGTSVEFGRVESNGDWLTRGDNDDGLDWVLKNGSVIAVRDDPIATTETEAYSDAPFGVTFFLFAGNNNGDYVVGGTTDKANDASNAVLVLNSEHLIAREDDPIDLDGNGVLDDGVRIRTFGNDDLVLSDDMQIVFTVTMRDYNDDGSNGDVGDALIKMDLCRFTLCGDLDNDGDVDGDDYARFLLAFGRLQCEANYHRCADYDRDGVISLVDYQQWYLCYLDFVGPEAPPPVPSNLGDMNLDGKVNGRDIQGFADVLVDAAGAGFVAQALADTDLSGEPDLADIESFMDLLFEAQ